MAEREERSSPLEEEACRRAGNLLVNVIAKQEKIYQQLQECIRRVEDILSVLSTSSLASSVSGTTNSDLNDMIEERLVFVCKFIANDNHVTAIRRTLQLRYGCELNSDIPRSVSLALKLVVAVIEKSYDSYKSCEEVILAVKTSLGHSVADHSAGVEQHVEDED